MSNDEIDGKKGRWFSLEDTLRLTGQSDSTIRRRRTEPGRTDRLASRTRSGRLEVFVTDEELAKQGAHQDAKDIEILDLRAQVTRLGSDNADLLRKNEMVAGQVEELTQTLEEARGAASRDAERHTTERRRWLGSDQEKNRELSEERQLSRDLEADLDATKEREEVLLAQVSALELSRDRFQAVSEQEAKNVAQLRQAEGGLRTQLKNVGNNLNRVTADLAQKSGFLDNSYSRERQLQANLRKAHRGVSGLMVLTFGAGISAAIFILYWIILLFGPFSVVVRPW